jgi:hypothetical protein
MVRAVKGPAGVQSRAKVELGNAQLLLTTVLVGDRVGDLVGALGTLLLVGKRVGVRTTGARGGDGEGGTRGGEGTETGMIV